MRYLLRPEEIPTAWFNVVPHLPEPPTPPIHPGTGQPVGPDDLTPLFPMALIGQEVSGEPWIDIPGDVLDVLRLWRPTPLCRARRLEQALDTPARIYYKDESVSPAGSHKPNTAVPQVYFNRAEGTGRIATETGAGVVGVTNRDLRTFGEDLGTAERLAALMPPTVTPVAESAIRSPADAGRMAEAGFAAVLVGEALVRSADPEAAVRALTAVRRPSGKHRRGGSDAVPDEP